MIKRKEVIKLSKKLLEDYKIELKNVEIWDRMPKERKKEFDVRLLNIGMLDNKIEKRKDGYYFGKKELKKELEREIIRDIVTKIDTQDNSSEFINK